MRLDPLIDPLKLDDCQLEIVKLHGLDLKAEEVRTVPVAKCSNQTIFAIARYG